MRNVFWAAISSIIAFVCVDVIAQDETGNVISIERLSELTGNSGKHRDIWLDPKDDGKRKSPLRNQFSLDRNSQYRVMFGKSEFREVLQFSSDQIEEMDAATENTAKLLEDLSDSYANASPDEKRKLETLSTELISEYDQTVESIMLPHQLRALQQVLLRSYATRAGFFASLVDGLFADQLSVSRDQKQNLRKAAKRVASDLKRDIDKLRREAVKEMISHLNSEQKAILKEQLGDDYEDKIAPHVERLINELERLSNKQ